jgi:hypothetical protein
VHRAEVMFTFNSRDLRMWFSMVSSRMISFKKVNLETETQRLEREHNKHDVLEALGHGLQV